MRTTSRWNGCAQVSLFHFDGKRNWYAQAQEPRPHWISSVRISNIINFVFIIHHLYGLVNRLRLRLLSIQFDIASRYYFAWHLNHERNSYLTDSFECIITLSSFWFKFKIAILHLIDAENCAIMFSPERFTESMFEQMPFICQIFSIARVHQPIGNRIDEMDSFLLFEN